MPSCCLEAPQTRIWFPRFLRASLQHVRRQSSPYYLWNSVLLTTLHTLSFPGFTFTHSSKCQLASSPICWLVCLPPPQRKLQDSRGLACGVHSCVSTTEDNAQQAVCLQQMWVMNESAIIWRANYKEVKWGSLSMADESLICYNHSTVSQSGYFDKSRRKLMHMSFYTETYLHRNWLWIVSEITVSNKVCSLKLQISISLKRKFWEQAK